jgi:hypothetical protein
MLMQRAWPIGFFSQGAAIGLAAVMALHLHAAPALAQGATGGSIGKQDKSLSGDQDGGGSRSTSPKRERPSSSERSSKRSSGGGGGGGNYDGTWTAASIGQTCNVQSASVVSISGGHMTAEGFSGRVSGGSVTGSWSGSGMSANFTGRISGRSGSGSWRRSDGCIGRWSMSKN